MKNIKMCKLLFCILMLMLSGQASRIQAEEDAELESLYDQFDQEEEKRKSKRKQETQEKEAESLGDLANLAPFSDVAVIQRKYLPRTGRFEASLSGTSLLNNVFFHNFGANLDLAYFWSERFGIELSYGVMSEGERDTTSRLKQKGIETETLVVPKSYTGIALRWTPIYGKMSLFNKKIVPFDIYFAPGIGTSKTDDGNTTTIHLETGQVFAISKNFAFRWDFNWNFYQVETQENDSNGNPQTLTKNQNDLFLGVGLSFFFPGAKYR